MQADNCVPEQVLQHCVVFVLAHTIIGMQVDLTFSETVHLEKVMEEAHDGVGSLSSITGLIYQVIDLTGQCLTADPKESTLSRLQKVYWAWLQ